MKLESETHWRQYKDIVDRANVVFWEVVVEITRKTRSHDPVERLEEIPVDVDSLTQGSTVSQDVLNLTSSGACALDFDKAVASHHFDDSIFEEEDGGDDDIFLGSEDNEYYSSDHDDHNDDDEEIGEEEPEGNAVGAQVEQENDDGGCWCFTIGFSEGYPEESGYE